MSNDLEQNSSYYQNALANKKLGTLFPKWNWSSFFFGPACMLYRGMVAYTIIVFFLEVLTVCLLGYYSKVIVIQGLLHLVTGIFGNALYGMFLMKRYGHTIETHNFRQNDNVISPENLTVLLKNAPKTSIWRAIWVQTLMTIVIGTATIFTSIKLPLLDGKLVSYMKPEI